MQTVFKNPLDMREDLARIAQNHPLALCRHYTYALFVKRPDGYQLVGLNHWDTMCNLAGAEFKVDAVLGCIYRAMPMEVAVFDFLFLVELVDNIYKPNGVEFLDCIVAGNDGQWVSLFEHPMIKTVRCDACGAFDEFDHIHVPFDPSKESDVEMIKERHAEGCAWIAKHLELAQAVG